MADFDFLNGFLIPILEISFIGALVFGILFVIIRAFVRVWKRRTKFALKYGILRRKLPEDTMKWCYNAIDQGIGYWDAKKYLMIQGVETNRINETMWLYDKVLKEVKGGIKNGGINKGSVGKNEVPATSNLPTYKTN